jgi:GTP-binding protein Era
VSFKSGYIGLVGLPNAGKSTLLNALIQSKVAIVSSKAQTTRHVIVGVVNQPSSQIVFLDTPGFHQVGDGLSKQMVKATSTAIPDVDLVYFLVYGKRQPNINDERLLGLIKKDNKKVFLILNKIDELKKEMLMKQLMLWSELYDFDEIIPISALKENNLDHLLKVTADYLPEGLKFYESDVITTQSDETLISEVIREKIVHLTNQEVPHSVAVKLDEVEFEENRINILAQVIVDRDSQKGIILGKNGTKKNEIIKQASIDLRRMYQRKIYLKLFVKVSENWRNKQSRLKEYGYDSNQ